MNKIPLIILVLAAAFISNNLFAQAQIERQATPDDSVLTKEQWKQLDASVKRGLEWLITQQADNGSFKGIDAGQPAVTAFGLMAFLSTGESPVDGKYSKQLSKSIDYIASQQKPNGLIAVFANGASPISRKPEGEDLFTSNAITYNHAISALALSEAYGQCNEDQAKILNDVIEKAIAATIEMQNWKHKRKAEEGGWKYTANRYADDADLSATCWQLMFLRSARNAGFDVPAKNIERAVAFVERCFDKKQGVFLYTPPYKNAISRAMAGAGIVALAHGGKHDTEMAQRSGDWLLTRDFTKYNADKPAGGLSWQPDRYHYGVFHGTQAMYELGGRHWKKFYPPVVETLLASQQPDGAWPAETYDARYGNSYTTSLCILALSIPNQMLPIFQR